MTSNAALGLESTLGIQQNSPIIEAIRALQRPRLNFRWTETLGDYQLEVTLPKGLNLLVSAAGRSLRFYSPVRQRLHTGGRHRGAQLAYSRITSISETIGLPGEIDLTRLSTHQNSRKLLLSIPKGRVRLIPSQTSDLQSGNGETILRRMKRYMDRLLHRI